MTTFKLQPTNLTEVVFSVDSIGNNGYYVPATTIDLHIAEREEIVYSSTQYGGDAIYTKNKLAPITFSVFVWGDTRQEMLTRSHTLNQAIEKGGNVEYKPTGANRSTFYTFVRSDKPAQSQVSNNEWDAQNASGDKFVMAFEVKLQTKPIGFSTWGLYTEGWTINNVDNASYNNYASLTNIVGDQPAALQLYIQGAGGESPPDLYKLYLSTRSAKNATLSNLVTTYEAENVESTTGFWETQTDANRSNGSYMRLTPASSSTWYRLSWLMQNVSDHNGQLVFIPVVKAANSDAKFRMAFYLGSEEMLVLTSDDSFTIPTTGQWSALYAGEFTFPLIEESDVAQIITVSLEMMSSDTIDVDFISVMFSDESAMEINFGTPLSGYEKLFLSKSQRPNRIANVVVWGGE